MTRIIKYGLIVALIFFLPMFGHGEETVSQLKERIIDIQNEGTLGIINFNLCSNIESFA